MTGGCFGGLPAKSREKGDARLPASSRVGKGRWRSFATHVRRADARCHGEVSVSAYKSKGRQVRRQGGL